VGFEQFIGNRDVVTRLREAIAADRLPSAMILSGADGAGKYTLALMVAQAANCLARPLTDGLADFCGECANCVRIGAAAPLGTRFAEAVAAREELRDADKKDTRILIQTHPDVLIIPPDPPQMLIKLGQVRTVIGRVYRRPAEARRAMYLFTSAGFMKEAANSLLKVLEEPPEYASLMLLAENPNELLPTIRSRAQRFHLGALPPEEIERLLATRRPELKPRERALVERLAEGGVGRALGFDLPAFLASRADALTMLRTALGDPDYSALFRMTEAYRAGAEGQAKTAALLHALALLLEDLLLAHSGAAGLVRNIDCAAELTRWAGEVTPRWIEGAARGLDGVESGMRRNLLRSLSLDALATEMASARPTGPRR
jgi:DNA polymerase-3 subunit delta'